MKTRKEFLARISLAFLSIYFYLAWNKIYLYQYDSMHDNFHLWHDSTLACFDDNVQ